MHRTVRVTSWVLGLVLLGAQSSAAQDVLGHARALYEEAAYEDALQLLDRYTQHSDEAARPGRADAIDEYRALCLLALKRTGEAEAILVRLVTSNPVYTPSFHDPTPRFRAAVVKARSEVIPPVAERLYDEAAAAVSRRRYNDASVILERLLRIVQQDALDTRLTHWVSEVTTAGKALLEVSRHSQTVYMTGDAGVTPAVAIRQNLPDPSVVARRIVSPHSGELELIIDPSGAVESATLPAPIHRDYDSLLLKAAKAWTYRPAQLNGRPVLWRTVVAIHLAPIPQTSAR